VFDAPSVYLEILSELGAVGLLLLAVALVGIAGGAARRARGRERAVYAAVIAIVAAWALGAGLDWEWEMPAVTIPVFVLGGAALARSGELVRAWRPHPLLRVGLVAVLLLLVVTPARVAVSQAHLDRAVDALADGNCSQAVPAATQAHRAAPDRAEPLQVEALCAIRDGQGEKAATLIQQALDRDPWSWRLRLDLALARAVSGEDPRPAWFLARQLNPQGLEIKRMGEIFGSTPRRRWPEVARTVQMPFPRSD
jgi:hypothetical protein